MANDIKQLNEAYREVRRGNSPLEELKDLAKSGKLWSVYSTGDRTDFNTYVLANSKQELTRIIKNLREGKYWNDFGEKIRAIEQRSFADVEELHGSSDETDLKEIKRILSNLRRNGFYLYDHGT